MKRLITVAIAILFLFSHQALAQDGPTLENLIDAVNNTAEAFSEDFNQLTADLDAAVNSEAQAREKYEKMIESVDMVLDRITDESEIWQTSDTLLQQFEQNREHAQQKAAESNSPEYWKESARDWAAQADKLREVRDDLLSQRASLANTREQIIESKDIAIDLIKRERAKQAIAQMKVVRDHLAEINQNLQGIVERTKRIGAASAPSE